MSLSQFQKCEQCGKACEPWQRYCGAACCAEAEMHVPPAAPVASQDNGNPYASEYVGGVLCQGSAREGYAEGYRKGHAAGRAAALLEVAADMQRVTDDALKLRQPEERAVLDAAEKWRFAKTDRARDRAEMALNTAIDDLYLKTGGRAR